MILVQEKQTVTSLLENFSKNLLVITHLKDSVKLMRSACFRRGSYEIITEVNEIASILI